jgi:Fe-Mn family superoxide dismutase
MYKVPPLNYSYDALEPYIDERTVDIHYNKHHLGYLNKLNNILNSINYNYNDSLEQLVQNIDQFPIKLRGDILFNAGGVLNHNLYWYNMSPNKNNKPVGLLKQEIEKKYGSYENFKETFIEQATSVVGSGWTFLVINHKGELEIINTTNQETPYLYGLEPIMGIDLWEHSYYLKYQNRRDEYILNFFEIVDFNNINRLYEQKIKKASSN